MRRRQFIQGTLGASLAAPSILIGRAGAQRSFPIADLRAGIDQTHGAVVSPNDAEYASLRRAYNLRTLRRPEAIVAARTPAGVASAVAWARSRKVPFSVRGGGHSYEGLSQSDGLVIDLRRMDGVEIDPHERTVSVGGGATLGKIYRAVSAIGLAVPGGSCPTVGIAGNTLGGGYGFVARKHGMSCDCLLSLELVDAGGRMRVADARSDADLFWACRGAGGGSFGVVTRLKFLCHVARHASVFGVGWELPPGRARSVMRAWQLWAPNAPDEITSILRITRSARGIALRCAGQWTGSSARIEAELRPLLAAAAPSPGLWVRETSFLGAVRHFTPPDEPTFMKGKSDYVTRPMSEAGIDTLFDGLMRLPANAIVVICDAYGGAISRVGADETAFPHRQSVLYSMQYYAQLPHAASQARIGQIRNLYAAMRPHVSGRAYSNYADLDLADAGAAYWGGNLVRLRQIKSAVDPENLFRHAQSVPTLSGR